MDKAYTNLKDIKERALKITEALYRTTELFFDGEPLKWSLRQNALEILNIISATREGASHEQTQQLRKLEGLINDLFIKLELASSGSFISGKNFEVLHREYLALHDRVSAHRNDNGQLLLSDFITDKAISDSIKKELEAKIEIPEEREKNVEKKIEAKIEAKYIKPVHENGVPADFGQRNVERRGTILTALKANGPSSVGDLSKLFQGAISEKTVQRELNSMVTGNILKMSGEKRWRRYFVG
ncbi:hypothetical protein HYT01_01315 [Candidatus Giovannonibacteria bacterium]|nr:hypothetical protein [Candidatus Giovannonibacteria bacterium]